MTSEYKWLSSCAALALGEACGFFCERYAALAPAVAVLDLLWSLYGYGLRWRGWSLVAIFLAGIALAFASVLAREAVLETAFRAAPGRPQVLRVEVRSAAEIRTDAHGTRQVSFTGVVGELPVRVVGSVNLFPSVPLVGEEWECTGWLARTPSPGGGPRPFWLRGEGTGAVRVGAADGLSACLARVRSELARRIGFGLEHDPATAALNRAILLGDRQQIDPSEKRRFVAAGTIHVFAISGLHVMVIAKVLQLLLLPLFVSFRYMGLVLIPLMWLYALMIGLPSSAVRATLMITFYALAPVFLRRPNGLVSWAIAFLLVHVVAPTRLLEVGSEMSFVVMLALLFTVRCLGARMGRLASLAGFSFAAWAAGVPIAAHVFGRVTPGGLLANLAVLPVATVGVATGALGALSSFVSRTLAVHFNNLSALMTRTMAGISEVVADLPGSNFEVSPWPLWECALWYVAFALLLWLLPRCRSKMV